jgi:co-chaperonin GroES (HSP10)
MSKFIPGSDRVLITVVEQDKMLDGILLPDSSKEDMQAGVVLVVGPKVTQWVERDQVIFGPHAGMNIQIEGVPFRVMREGEIMGKVVSDVPISARTMCSADIGTAVLLDHLPEGSH